MEKIEKAILVALHLKSQVYEEDSLEELAALAKTAGVEVVDTVVQSRESADSKWMIGKGKVEELKLLGEELGAELFIFDQELSGTQTRNLEQHLEATVIDRTQLILDIFAQRASTKEGIVQVGLAQYTYLLPRLQGQGEKLSRLGAGIGTRGPGETKLEKDRRHIKRRIHELKTELKEIVKHRELHRKQRKKSSIPHICLVGYTNAGKSTLLNQLSQSEILAKDQLFATLDPTTRQATIDNNQKILLTDTVGFIQNLPHDLVAAFSSTLEEVNQADLIVHVIDSSSSYWKKQKEVVEDILEKLNASDIPQLLVFNKIDKCTVEDLPQGENIVHISAYEQSDLVRLRQKISEILPGQIYEFCIETSRGDLIAGMYRVSQQIEQTVEEDFIRLKVRLNPSEYEKILPDYQAYLSN